LVRNRFQNSFAISLAREDFPQHKAGAERFGPAKGIACMAIDNVNVTELGGGKKAWALLRDLVRGWRRRDAAVQQKMVRWYSPKQLLRTSSEVLISSILGRHADRRSIEASNRPPKYFDFTSALQAPPTQAPTKDDEKFTLAPKSFPLAPQQGTLWIDYVSDLGDGWNSTYAVAYQLAQESFTVKLPEGNTETLCRGNILIFGGDEVYPTAERTEYENRLVTPYKLALPTKPTNPPFLFALPGNHDWYDSLSSFIEFFGDFERSDFADGRWRVPQNRSYFALKLPQGWWILGVDVQLQSDLDHWQFKYFKHVVQMMQPGDRVILCCAEPYWMYNNMFKAARKKYEKSNLKQLVDLIDPKNVLNARKETASGNAPDKERHIALFLAGDLHHYFRVLNHERTELSITAGGGGAFLHPTHGLVNRAFKTKPFQPNRYQTKGYPSPRQSWWLGLWNLLFLRYNFSFGWITAVLYLLFSWFLSIRLGPDGVMDMIQPPIQSISDLVAPAWKALIDVALLNPFLVFFMTAMVLGFILFTKTEPNSPSFRWLGGMLHGSAHICAAIYACILGVVVYKAVLLHDATAVVKATGAAALAIFVLSWVLGCCLMGLYLFLALNLCGQHITAAFSSLRIEDWKNFLRLKLDLATGELTIYPIGLRRVPRTRAWEPQHVGYDTVQPPATFPYQHFKPKDETQLQVELIEGPIKVTPHKKKGVEISFP
jgi:hypothetical protein